jgi:hypothetical protein
MGKLHSATKGRQMVGAFTRARRDATGDRPSRPAILTSPNTIDTRLTAPAEVTPQRQPPLPNDALTTVAGSGRRDEAGDRAA